MNIVDNSIEYKGKEILFEIDSGNMAKLIAGQYTLLNTLCDNPESKIFIVIHYYKDYNTQRTIKNLGFLADKLFKEKRMRFKVYNRNEFEEICKNNSGNNDGFLKKLIR